jgi:hypothetical protein
MNGNSFLLEFSIDAGVVASEDANADDNNVNRAMGGQAILICFWKLLI